MSEKAKKQTAEIIDPGLGELDKVRNILFGRQVKAYEEKFAEVEASLNQMIIDLNTNLESRLKVIESNFTEFEETIAIKFKEAETGASDEYSNVRNNIESINTALSTDLAQAKGELRAEMNKVTSKLSTDKTDRESLAMLFDEMSMRLRNNENKT